VGDDERRQRARADVGERRCDARDQLGHGLPAGEAKAAVHGSPGVDRARVVGVDVGRQAPLPRPDVGLHEAVVEDGQQGELRADDLRGLARAGQRARVQRDQPLAGHGASERARLRAPAIVQRRVAAALEAMGRVVVGLPVAHEQNLIRAGHDDPCLVLVDPSAGSAGSPGARSAPDARHPGKSHRTSGHVHYPILSAPTTTTTSASAAAAVFASTACTEVRSMPTTCATICAARWLPSR
jgi:hypothetical protein